MAGKWNKSVEPTAAHLGGHYILNMNKATEEATYSLEVPEDGKYYIWICHEVHPEYLASFILNVTQNDQQSFEYATKLSSKEGISDDTYIYRVPGQVWSKHVVDLKKGAVKLGLATATERSTMYAFSIDALMITGDPEFIPSLRRD